MRSLICKQPGLLEYQEIPRPLCTPGQAIVKIRRVGICGTDLHAFEGTQPFFSYPRIFGHELAGDLIEWDAPKNPELRELSPGDPVSIIPYFHCGNCIACRNGKPNCCAQLKVCGVHIDGGLVDYLSVPADSLFRSEGLVYEELALLEPLAIGAHATRRAAVREGEWVMIAGAGPIGLAAMEFCRIAGANVIALDREQARLQFCRDKQKAAFFFPGYTTELKEWLMELTHGQMPTVIMDATGSRDAINSAFQYLAHSGRYILVGLQKGEVQFSHPSFHSKESTLMSSRNATREDFRQVAEGMKKGRIRAADYITHTHPFESLAGEFQNLVDPSRMVIKAIVDLD